MKYIRQKTRDREEIVILQREQLHHVKKARPMNKCHMQRKGSLPKATSEPRTSNPHGIGDALTVAPPDRVRPKDKLNVLTTENYLQKNHTKVKGRYKDSKPFRVISANSTEP